MFKELIKHVWFSILAFVQRLCWYKEINKEPHLLKEDDTKYVLPEEGGYKYPQLLELYRTHQKAQWSMEELIYNEDAAGWAQLNPNEQRFFEFVLAFFAVSDGLLAVESLAEKMLRLIKISEARLFYGIQIYMENVHSQTYTRLISELIASPERRKKLFHAVENIPSIKRKTEWLLKWLNKPSLSLAELIVVMACFEGICFSSSFCSIFWLKKDRANLLPGLINSNNLIARDEGIHYQFAVELYKLLKHPLPQKQLFKMIHEIVKIERQFCLEALPTNLIGMNAQEMTQYVQYVANYLTKQLGYAEIYPGIDNPFPWMEMLSIQTKTNGFEHRTTEYSK